jgi:hypothetical protein
MMKLINAASLRCVIAPAEVTMPASPTYRALSTMPEGKALTTRMIQENSLDRGATALPASSITRISYSSIYLTN